MKMPFSRHWIMYIEACLRIIKGATFGFDFEDWVTGGYFEGDYIPYSFIENGKIISNVSANRMNFLQNGVEKHYIQIGTVMTDEAYRKQGLAKKLIEHVVKQYEDKCDGADDYRLFYLGEPLKSIEKEKLYFPEFSHA